MNIEIVSLNISELVVSLDPIVVNTVLGSCVSVCLFCETGKGGGIIHFALPELPNNSVENPLRYGNYATEKLIFQVCKETSLEPFQLRAKIVGGANNIASAQKSQQVGQANVKVARELLNQYKIPIVGEDVGGSFGRKILFNVQSGRLQVAIVGPGYARPSAKMAVASTPRSVKKVV